MDPRALRYVLVLDWARVENTPQAEHRPAELQRWRIRAMRLAELEGRPMLEVTKQLKHEAQALAARQRQELLVELARDLAVSRAMGKNPTPPWRRRLQRLVQVMGLPIETVRDQVERQAENVQVVVMSSH